MHNLLVLLAGELDRAKKYYILSASLLVSVIWIGVLQLTEIKDVTFIFPLLVFVDATSMATLLIGVTMFFEKQEGSIKTLLVSPITNMEYILAKTLANIILNIIGLVLLYVYARLFKDISISVLGLLGAVTLVSFFHSLVGFLLTYRSREFTDLLMGMLKYLFVLTIPVFLEHVGLVTNPTVKGLLFVLPTKASMVLLNATTGGTEFWQIAVSVSYLAIGSALLYSIVLKGFDDFAAKESGV